MIYSFRYPLRSDFSKRKFDHKQVQQIIYLGMEALSDFIQEFTTELAISSKKEAEEIIASSAVNFKYKNK